MPSLAFNVPMTAGGAADAIALTTTSAVVAVTLFTYAMKAPSLVAAPRPGRTPAPMLTTPLAFDQTVSVAMRLPRFVQTKTTGPLVAMPERLVGGRPGGDGRLAPAVERDHFGELPAAVARLFAEDHVAVARHPLKRGGAGDEVLSGRDVSGIDRRVVHLDGARLSGRRVDRAGPGPWERR